MNPADWNTYRTRFLVKAKQLNSSLSFVDSLGREHSGRKGDYLVESSDGLVTITPRQIFEDIYVPMTRPDDRRFPPAPDIRRKYPQACRDRRPPAHRMGLM